VGPPEGKKTGTYVAKKKGKCPGVTTKTLRGSSESGGEKATDPKKNETNELAEQGFQRKEKDVCTKH